MRTFEELKQCLVQIKDNDYSVPNGADLDDIIADMLNFIGHTDGELRDDLIYSTFCGWVGNGTLSTVQMKHILTTCLGEQYLFFGIGEKESDSVFTRAFSSLAIALAFSLHDENSFLTVDDVQDIKKTVLRYIGQEKDYRGYVSGKGWAHAVAHIADALGNVAGCEIDGHYCHDRDNLLEILQAVKTLVLNRDCVYTAEEDERLVAVVNMVCSNEVLTDEDLITWINSFDPSSDDWAKYDVVPDNYYQYVNWKHFLRSLYFNFLNCGDDEFDVVNASVITKHLLTFLVESDD